MPSIMNIVQDFITAKNNLRFFVQMYAKNIKCIINVLKIT